MVTLGKKSAKVQLSYKDTDRRGVKLKRFQRAVIANPDMSPTEIAMQIYNCKSRKVASALSGRNLKKMRMKMADLMPTFQMSDEDDLNLLHKLRHAKKVTYFAHEGVVIDQKIDDDGQLQCRALELTQKIKGNYAQPKAEVVSQTLNLMEINLDPNRPVGDLVRDFTKKLAEGIKEKY